MINNFIFDFDGTLVDSVGDVYDCLKKAYYEANIPFTIEKKMAIIGPPLKEIIINITPSIDEINLSKIISNFRKIYDNNDYNNTKIMDGVLDILTLFNKNKKIFIATSKVKDATIKILKKFKISDYFDDLITIDSIPGKSLSKSEMITLLIDNYKLDKKKTILIGDMVADIEAAKNNQIYSAAYLNGYGDKNSLIMSKPDFLLSHMNELIKLV